MSGYDDLIPSPSRSRSAYDDLLPGGPPAVAVQPAEDARPNGSAAVEGSGLLARIRDKLYASAPKPIVPEVPEYGGNAIASHVKAFLDVFRPKGPESVTEAVRANERVRERDDALLGGPRKPAVIDEPPRHVAGPVNGPLLPFKDSKFSERLAEVPGAFRDAAARYKAGVDVLTSGGNPEKTRVAAEVVKELDRAATERRARTMVFNKDGSVDDSSLIAAADAAPSTLAGIGGTIVGGLPGMAAAVAPAVAPERYARGRTLGLDPVEAMAATVADVGQEAATERLGFGLLTRLSKLPAKVALARAEKDPRLLPLIGAEVGIQQGGEHASEQASNLMGWLLDKASGDPEATLGKLLEDAKKTAEVTAILSPVIGGATLAGSAARKAFTPKQPAQTHLDDVGALPVVEPAAPPAQALPPVPAAPAPAAPVSVSTAPIEPPKMDTAPAGVYDDLVPTGKQGELVFAMPANDKGDVVEPPVVEMPESPVKLVSVEELKAMRTQAATWARANIVDTTVKNAETGFDIFIPWSGVKHTIGRNSYPEDIATIPAIPGMLETGKLIESGPDDKGRRDIKAVYKFLSRAQVGEDVYRVLLTVREHKNGKRYYDHVAMKKETPSDKAGAEVQKATEYDTSPKGAVENVDEPPDDGNLGMPASTTVAPPIVPVPPAPSAAAGGTPKQQAVGKEQARPDAIRAAMAELFDTVISEKHAGRGNLGIYRLKPETVRLRNKNDLRTAAHEVGHHISNRNKPFRLVMKQHHAELVSIMPQVYKQMLAKGKTMPKWIQRDEGFAEFIADYLEGQTASLQKQVPGFFKAFETFLSQNPNYAAALQHVQGLVGAHANLGAADKILAKVGMFKKPLGQRVRDALSKDTWDSFVGSTLDNTDAYRRMVADLAPNLAESKNPHIAARLLAGDGVIIEDWVNNWTTPFDYQKRADTKNYGKPLKAILEPVLKGGEEQANKFKAYMIARRAAELKKAGKENLLDINEIRGGLALETPEFKQVAKEVYAYNDSLVDYAVEGGLLSPDVAKQFKQYASYIPFFRESESDAKGGGRGDPFKRLTGGTANLRDPIANLIQNTANIIHATNRNAVLRKTAELGTSAQGGGRWVESVPVPQQAHAISSDRIIEDLRKQGVTVDTAMAQNLAAMQTFFVPSGRGDDKTRTVVYKVGGELKAVQVNDPLLWKSMSSLPPPELDLITEILALPARTLRAGVVLDPGFMLVANPIRDTLSSMIQSKGKFIPGASTANGVKLRLQAADAFKLYRAFGGGSSSQFADPDQQAKIIERMAKRGNFSPASIISPARLLEALEKVGDYTESASRIAEFDLTYKPGDFDSALRAALNSREVATDFGMRGSNTSIFIWTRLVPFMRPAMQGMYKTARTLSGADGKKVAGKAAILGTSMALASMMLALSNADEDWYQKLEEWEKATYWHFKMGGQVWRIPKPFEYGLLFASMPEAMALLAAGKEGGEDFKKRMLQILSQVMIRAVPQAGVAIAEPWANKSFFTGRKIEPDRQQHLEPGLRSGPGTSKVAQVVGGAANVSPAMIDNVVRNVFGTMGVHAQSVADVLLEKSGAVPPSKERGWQSWPAIRRIVRDPENPNSKQLRDFYEQLDKYRAAVASVRELKERGEDTKAEAYAIEKSDELSLAKGAETASKRMGKIRKAMRAIDWDRDMSPADKRAAFNDQNAEIQDLATEQTRLYQATKKSYSQPAIEGAK